LNPNRKVDNFDGFTFDVNEYLSKSVYQKSSEKETQDNFYKVYGKVFLNILIDEENNR
jgi:hypothetical protein